jgi:hypothetical protein
MMIGRSRFNLYLVLALGLGLICGCNTTETKRKKVLSTFRLHQEVTPDASNRSQQVNVYRDHPVAFTVDRAPFLTEVNVKEAKIIDALGGFALSIQFDRQGTWLLEEYTTANRGRHLAIFSQFDEPNEEKLNPGRWLAAPLIQNHITDGLLIFTPDASRAEVEQLVLGLNNVAKKVQGTEPN